MSVKTCVCQTPRVIGKKTRFGDRERFPSRRRRLEEECIAVEAVMTPFVCGRLRLVRTPSAVIDTAITTLDVVPVLRSTLVCVAWLKLSVWMSWWDEFMVTGQDNLRYRRCSEEQAALKITQTFQLLSQLRIEVRRLRRFGVLRIRTQTRIQEGI